jgi:hypothetical protein
VAVTLNGSHRLLRYSPRDGLLVGLAFGYGALLLSTPSIPLIGIGLWWTANTVAHNFIHTPFFRSRALNRGFSLFLSALMGIPQSLWRERHLRHHHEHHAAESGAAITRSHRLWTRDAAIESGVVLASWAAIATVDPAFFIGVYLPGYAAGLGLCSLQGYFEHAQGTTSHYGWLYNWCFFNDGYHAEHHRRPGEHWTRLPRRPLADARRSRWPPVLRWIDACSLESLERCVMRSPRLQRFVLAAHERAFRILLQHAPPIHRVTIVGGGLYPRTALVLRRLLPSAALTIVDARAEHLATASAFLAGDVAREHRLFDASAEAGADLVVVPLAFIGDRDRVYRQPPAPLTAVHDWIWNRRKEGARVSWLLLKRINLVRR